MKGLQHKKVAKPSIKSSDAANTYIGPKKIRIITDGTEFEYDRTIPMPNYNLLVFIYTKAHPKSGKLGRELMLKQTELTEMISRGHAKEITENTDQKTGEPIEILAPANVA